MPADILQARGKIKSHSVRVAQQEWVCWPGTGEEVEEGEKKEVVC